MISWGGGGGGGHKGGLRVFPPPPSLYVKKGPVTGPLLFFRSNFGYDIKYAKSVAFGC